MFAPDGYCMIEALEDRIRAVLREVEDGPDFSGLSDDNPNYYIQRSELLAKFETALSREVRAHTLSALETIESVSICSPSGLVLRVSKAVLTPHSEFSESRLFALASDEHLRPVLLTSAWLIKNGRHFRNLNPTHLEENFARRRVKNGESDTNLRIYEFAEPFRSFIGWSLVFKEDDLPKKTELKFVIGPDANEARSGRPEKRQRALRAFDMIYPEGRKGVPWKVVAEAVSKAIEQPVSVITIQRAINDRSKLHQNSK